MPFVLVFVVKKNATQSTVMRVNNKSKYVHQMRIYMHFGTCFLTCISAKLVHAFFVCVGRLSYLVGGAVASWLVRSTPDPVRVRALAGDSVLCSWARHFTLTVPPSTQVYKWVPAICWGNLTKLQGSDLRWTSIPSRGSRNTSSRFMLQKPG